MSFEGKTAWITGASSGIGAALAREWAARGARIILSGRDEGRLAAVAGEIATDTLVLPFDVRDDEAMLAATEKAIGWRDGVDIFVANAGVSQRSAAVDTDIAVYREIIDIDLTAQIAATQALLPHVTARGSGTAVTLYPDASAWPLIAALPGLPPSPIYGRGADAKTMAERGLS